MIVPKITARSVFHVGDAVELSADGISATICRRRTGKVVGFSRCGRFIRVLPDGLKTVSKYHPKFWIAIRSVRSKPVEFTIDFAKLESKIAAVNSVDPRQDATPLMTVSPPRTDITKMRDFFRYAMSYLPYRR